jgi:hypothetical protein
MGRSFGDRSIFDFRGEGMRNCVFLRSEERAFVDVDPLFEPEVERAGSVFAAFDSSLFFLDFQKALEFCGGSASPFSA